MITTVHSEEHERRDDLRLLLRWLLARALFCLAALNRPLFLQKAVASTELTALVAAPHVAVSVRRHGSSVQQSTRNPSDFLTVQSCYGLLQQLAYVRTFLSIFGSRQSHERRRLTGCKLGKLS
jgi:hypothetical protein